MPRRHTVYELRKLMLRHGAVSPGLPLLPIKPMHFDTSIQYSQLDLCSRQQGSCDKCPDKEVCLELYDSLC